MAALNVAVFVTNVTENQANNSYVCTVVQSTTDTSGLTGFSLTFGGSLPARYAPGATGTLILP